MLARFDLVLRPAMATASSKKRKIATKVEVRLATKEDVMAADGDDGVCEGVDMNEFYSDLGRFQEGAHKLEARIFVDDKHAGDVKALRNRARTVRPRERRASC